MQDTTHNELIRLPTGSEIARAHSWAQVALQRLCDALLQPLTLVAAVVWLLNGTVMDVAIVTAAASMSYALGSLIMPYALAKVDDLRLVLLGANLVGAVASALMAVVGWRANALSHSNFVTLLVTSILFYQISAAANVNRNPRLLIVNETHPTSARSRQFIGAVAAILGGVVAWRTLANHDLQFERAAGAIFLLAGLASLGAIWFQITAPVRYSDLHQRFPTPSMAEIRALTRQSRVRTYMIVRILFGLATLADPFLIIFGLTQMYLNPWFLGAAMLFTILAQILGGMLWTFFGDMLGSRRSLQLAGILRLAALTLGLATPFVARSDWYAETFGSTRPGSWLFVMVFFLLSLAHSTYIRNEQHYAMRQLHEPALFPAVNFAINITLVVVAIVPILGAVLIEATSLETVMTVALGLGLIAFLSTALLAARRRLPRRALKPELRGGRKPIRRRKHRASPPRIRRS